MQLSKAIELAAEKEGSQRALAKALGIGENYISDMKNGLKPCTVENRIRIALIAGIDPTRAVIEGLAASLNGDDEHQAEAKNMLNAMLDAFPEEGERNS
ncbi:MAG: helix-turn-helix transcriptional regulator [Comamonas sp.]|uniref:helix-turn-helix transcriptional regulator n=1 Tax=Comamonas sp. TaxID=34028 RepID=UPI002FCA9081